MLAINADRPSAILLPALVTGCGPYTASRLAFLRMLNREQQPRPIHVSIIDGTFTQFDSTILVPGQVARPEIEEGFLLVHPEIVARSKELTTLLTKAGGAV
jgi:hypothetical protein